MGKGEGQKTPEIFLNPIFTLELSEGLTRPDIYPWRFCYKYFGEGLRRGHSSSPSDYSNVHLVISLWPQSRMRTLFREIVEGKVRHKGSGLGGF